MGLAKIESDKLEQVLLNLALNARDAMPNGGRLTIETANVTIDEEPAGRNSGVSPGEYVMLSITDTGTGIPEDMMPHIFEPFFTSKERGKGTGLGLFTCYAIISQSGGYIDVHSEPGRGTTFQI